MSIFSATGRLGFGGLTISRETLRWLGLLALAIGLFVLSSYLWRPLFYAVGAVVLLLLAHLSYRTPRVMLILVIFAPIIDRYLVNLLIAPALHDQANFLSEALLLLVGAVVAVRGARDGTLWVALRHPVVALLVAFVALATISAVLNGVPPLVAGAGILFTVDAAALFVLPRIIGFGPRHAAVAAAGFSALATVAGALALGQVILHPDFLGLESFAGRFSEGRRIAAFLVNPNMLGAVLAMGVPYSVISAVHAKERWARRVALGTAFIMVLALLYTFSRGAWAGLAVSMLVVGLVAERRALLLCLVLAAVAFGSAFVIPRHVLLPGAQDGFDLGGATLGRLDAVGEGSDLRILFIRNAMPIIGDHLLIGAGPGRYGGSVARAFDSPLYDRYTDGSVPRGRTVDNFWLHATVEFGLLGVVLLAGTLVLAVWQLLAAARRTGGSRRSLMAAFAGVAIILMVDSLAEMLLEGNTTAFALWFFLGVGSVLASEADAG